MKIWYGINWVFVKYLVTVNFVGQVVIWYTKLMAINEKL